MVKNVGYALSHKNYDYALLGQQQSVFFRNYCDQSQLGEKLEKKMQYS